MRVIAVSSPRLVPCGDRALLCYLGDGLDAATNDRVHGLARSLRRLGHPAVVEVTPGFHAVMVEYDPVRLRLEQLEEMVVKAAAELSAAEVQGSEVTIPVCYGGELGPDLAAVAQRTGLGPDEVIARHAGATYRVYCLGFSPGFPYLGGLDPALAAPRLAEPRVHVPGGAVGIAGEQTGVYPSPSPGGWQLIGRTPLRLFDADREPPALLQPGDRVRFVPIGPDRFWELEGRTASTRRAPEGYQPGRIGLRIHQPGLMTTLQDLGRRGYTPYGVPVGGAADYASLMIGNWLLGNRARTAALEITLTGPEVEFTGPTAFAITGAPIPAELIPADGGSPRQLAGWSSFIASPGDRLRLGTVTAGCRAYLCIAGGFDLPPVLGSLSEDLFGKLGPLGRPLKAGDWLPIGLPLHPPADLAGRSLPADAVPRFESSLVIRATAGPQEHLFSPDALAAFFGGTYRIGPASDRQGLRLVGPGAAPLGEASMLSEPIPPGSVQVPPGGQPILLLNNRQTIGGYPKIAVAVYTDLWAAAQLKEGDQVRFEQVDVAESHAIAWQERRRLAQIRRHLERAMAPGARLGAVEAIPRPAAAAPPPTAPQVPATAGLAHTYRITIAGIEFICAVEEVTG